MNTDSRYQLVDRYLDGLTAPEDKPSLTEAVEADPDVLAFLCESAELEAGLQKLLTPEPRAFAVPRILPFWHWRRAGKWLSAGAAAAALLTIAALVLWPRGGMGGEVVQRKSGVSVKRFEVGDQDKPKLQPLGGVTASVVLKQAEFLPDEKWLLDLKRSKIFERADFETGITTEVKVTEDEFLVRYLKAAGVTFPEGASARWNADPTSARNPSQKGFTVVNTVENLTWISGIGQDPENRGPRYVMLSSTVYAVKAGDEAPPIFASERVLTAEEQSLPRSNANHRFSSNPTSYSPMQCGFKEEWRGRPGVAAEITAAFCRSGDYILVSGLCVPVTVAGKKLPNTESLDEMEFSLMLGDSEEAVLRLGRSSDGTQWILTIRAEMTPVPQTLELTDVPNVMKFDSSLVTVKTGSRLRLVHRNEKCALAHNFVLVKPGRRDAVGLLSDAMLSDPEGLQKLYIPQSPDIIVAGRRLVWSGQSEVIEFTAPDEPGDYPYLCTFPGHWRLQNGILRVVK